MRVLRWTRIRATRTAVTRFGSSRIPNVPWLGDHREHRLGTSDLHRRCRS